jgi:hypothetical protein
VQLEQVQLALVDCKELQGKVEQLDQMVLLESLVLLAPLAKLEPQVLMDPPDLMAQQEQQDLLVLLDLSDPLA